ncbi:hypothetical protein CJ030_MR2G009970 [Morella rubra]|uniref:Uncharacterized protein n=1 Tax=Morella rubra TaxID=262757 RepID=A0A6A1WHC4_9ROSI|nr:hypothetical protein CJ030_MR2G009970 [Morella rubra]
MLRILKRCYGPSLYAGTRFSFTRHPSGIYGVAEANWSIPYSGDGEQARYGRPFIRQKFILSFWRILYLIFAYDIEPRAHTIECPILRGELMLSVARGCVVDLPLRQQRAHAPEQQQQVDEPSHRAHLERPAWADAWMINLKGMVEAAILPMHQLCIDLETRVSSMETQMMGLQPFLTTTSGTLRVMSRRLGTIEISSGR